ncbi:hypothetical protein ACOMHN_058075 [Nucella lapillus]
MTKTGKKARIASKTARKFGQRKKRPKTAAQSSKKLQQATVSPSSSSTDESQTQPSTSTRDIPSTSSGVTHVASKRKISFFQKEDTSSGTDTGDSEGEGADSEGEGTEVNTPTSEELNLIVNVGCLQTIIGRLACPECHKTLLMVREGGKDFRHGSACYLEVCCRDCGKVSWDFTSKKSGSTHTGFDVNRRIVTTASSCGFSFSQIKRQFALMGMPQPMTLMTITTTPCVLRAHRLGVPSTGHKQAECNHPPHDHPLPADIGEAIKPIYQRLGDPQLLHRCLAGKTQNSNESLHSLLWSICPKERWASLRTVDTALGIAVQKFIQGSTALLNILLELELMQNTRAAEYGEQEDVKRVNKATRRSSQQAQEKRKKIDDIRRRERQAFLACEGPAYGAGEY